MTAFFTVIIGLILALVGVKIFVWVMKILGSLTGWIIKGLLIVVMVVGVVALLGVLATAIA